MMRLAWTTNPSWLVAISAILLAACGGRSDLEFGEGDGGTESGVETGADVVYDHVNDTNGCNPNTCGGCCDESGNCRAGLESVACGIGGYDCVDCTAFNASCNASNHQCGPAEACGPTTCPNGCCDGNKCVDGTSDWACGTGGQACVGCSMYSTCDPEMQQCVESQECGSWNCEGCCDANGECQWGGDAWACGIGGMKCANCSEMGLSCDPDSYTCAGEACGPWNCGGCCDASGQCLWGGTDSACGWGGTFCEDCSSAGMTCDTNQFVCVEQQECGPWNCEGCCDAYGQCYWGGDDWACGGGGVYCDDCTSYGGVCDPTVMACVLPSDCGFWNCAGCCTDTYPSECVDGTHSWGCGTGGDICETCSPNQYCESQPWGGGACVGNMVDAGTACGPENCDGCCTHNGQCRPGKSDHRCGTGGESCVNCSASNLSCDDGICVP